MSYADQMMKCILTAKDAGCPRDQVKELIEHGYIPLNWQWRFHSVAREADRQGGPVLIGVGGARGGGKSHCIFAQAAIDDALRVPGLKGLFLRQTGKAAKESFDDLIAKILAKRIQYELSGQMLRFPNGSRLLLGGFKDDKDIDKYIGIEYDLMAIEEINQLTENKVEMLRGSLRTSKPNWRPRLYCSFNPGGIGHGYVKKTFISPFRNEMEKESRFIPSTFRDNPNLNQEYIDYLQNLTGQLGQAWRDGDFDILAGQFFSDFIPNLHVIEPFEIPLDWRRFCCLDYGYGAASALYWLAVAPDSRIYVYRELYETNLSFSQLAEAFSSSTPIDEKIEYLVADPSIWNRDGRSDLGLSGAEIFSTRFLEINKSLASSRSIHLERGNNDRINGWRVVREALRPYAKDGKTTARLQIFDTCYNLVRTFPLQVHSERNPEDLDTDLEDHAVDSLRYGLMSRPKPRATVRDVEQKVWEAAMKRKKQTSQAKTLFIR